MTCLESVFPLKKIVIQYAKQLILVDTDEILGSLEAKALRVYSDLQLKLVRSSRIRLIADML